MSTNRAMGVVEGPSVGDMMLEPGEVVVTNINYTRLPPAMQRMLNQSSFTRMEMSCDHPGCNYSAEDRASLMLHKFCKKNHLYCLKCDLLFEKKEYLFLHLLIGIGHSEVCPCCAKEFDTRETLRDHGLINHTTEFLEAFAAGGN